MSEEGPLVIRRLDDGAVWHVRLDAPPGNVLDDELIGELTVTFAEAADAPGLRAILLDAEGDDFSWGASVEEHLPGRFEGMLDAFHGMFRRMLDTAVPCVAAVRGKCLGGGLELASFCHRVVAAPDARLGQPEIVLGVIAPVASVALVDRMGRGAAEDLCLTGRTIEAEEALVAGLVDEVAADPTEAALGWIREHLVPRSASSLRHAVRAVRAGFAERFRADLDRVEAIYEDLMTTEDAVEGLEAFLEKRSPEWRHR